MKTLSLLPLRPLRPLRFTLLPNTSLTAQTAATNLRGAVRSEERFRLLLANVKDYAIDTLDPTGIVTSWSSGAEALTGYREGEIIGRHFSLFYPPAALAAAMPAREIEIARDAGRYEEESERVRRDGSGVAAPNGILKSKGISPTPG